MKSQDIIIHSFPAALGVISGMTLSNRDFLSFAQFETDEAYVTARKEIERKFLSDMKEMKAMDINDFVSIVPLQVHGASIAHIHKHMFENKFGKSRTKNPVICVEADGLYTFDHKILLCVGVADCAGIVICDTKGEFIAVLHSGWRGTVGACISGTEKNSKSIVRTCIEDVVIPHNIHLEDLHIWISPSAKSCCYEIGDEITHLFMDYPKSILRKDDAVYIDISMYISEELQELGISKQQITRDNSCTICDKKFHSHRRDAAQAGRGIVFVGRT